MAPADSTAESTAMMRARSERRRSESRKLIAQATQGADLDRRIG